MESNYSKYRGKCKEMVDMAIIADPSLKAIRGHYHCPVWGKQKHWWCVRKDGSIYDPTAKQFPSGGIAEYYEEFNGIITCDECGKHIPEDMVRIDGNYAFCSMACNARFVGL